MNSLQDVFAEIIHKLNSSPIDYMVVGSIASMVYGDPRLTRDMDIVIELSPNLIQTLTSFFPEDQFYLPPHEVISDEILNRRQFNVIHSSSGLKIDFVLRKNTPHGLEEFKRRKKIELFEGCEGFIASPEDVIIKKLSYFQEGQSEKHIRDIRGIMANTEIDEPYLEKWIQDLHLDKAWTCVK